jgi:hypothetical protein
MIERADYVIDMALKPGKYGRKSSVKEPCRNPKNIILLQRCT